MSGLNQRISSCALALAVGLGAQNAYAVKTLAGQTVFYNPQVVVFDSDFLQAGNKELKARFGKRETTLNLKINTLRADVKKFEESRKAMSAAQREKSAKSLRERDIALQTERNALTQATVPLKQFIDVEMTKMLRAACVELNQETGCTAVLDAARNAVMYVAPEADVTQALRQKVDVLWAKKKASFVFPK